MKVTVSGCTKAYSEAAGGSPAPANKQTVSLSLSSDGNQARV